MAEEVIGIRLSRAAVGGFSLCLVAIMIKSVTINRLSKSVVCDAVLWATVKNLTKAYH